MKYDTGADGLNVKFHETEIVHSVHTSKPLDEQ